MCTEDLKACSVAIPKTRKISSKTQFSLREYHSLPVLTRQVIKNRCLSPVALEPGEVKAEAMAALVSSVAWTLLDTGTSERDKPCFLTQQKRRGQAPSLAGPI